MNAACSGSGFSGVPSASIVVTVRPCTALIGVSHERVALAVHVHGAGAALPDPAAEFGAVEIQLIAKHPEERRVLRGVDGDVPAVDAELDH